jgi:hypothetical protein
MTGTERYPSGDTACPLLKVLQRCSLARVSQFLASAHAAHAAHVHHAASHDNSMWLLELLILVVGIIIGRIWGRRVGLKHLGATEFQSRWNNVRRHRPF